jgi:hypothetical protein
MKSNEQLPEITLKFDEFGAEDGLSGFMMFVKHCNWPIDISFVEMENGDKQLAARHHVPPELQSQGRVYRLDQKGAWVYGLLLPEQIGPPRPAPD